MAYIPTAKLAPSHKATCGESICEVQRRVTQLSTGLGVQVRVVDLAVTQSQDLEMTLTGVDCLYVEGVIPSSIALVVVGRKVALHLSTRFT
jgi:peptidase E